MGRVLCTWDQASLDEALAQVHGGNSIRSVSRETKIPRTTLQRALDGGMNNDVKSFSRRLLTSEEEVMIVDWACLLAELGWPVSERTSTRRYFV